MPRWWWGMCRCWIAVSVSWCWRGGLVLGWGRRWGWRRRCLRRRGPPVRAPAPWAVARGGRRIASLVWGRRGWGGGWSGGGGGGGGRGGGGGGGGGVGGGGGGG